MDIYTLEVAGGLPRRLTPEASLDAVPSWSGDGRWIYSARTAREVLQVWKVPADGGPAIQLTRNGGFAAFESPDGSRLYYAKFDAPGIWTVPVNGGEEKGVYDLPPTGYWGYWDIGRRGLYFVNPDAKPRPTIELLDLATRRVTRIAEMERQPIQWTSGFSVARDERSILYSQWSRAAATSCWWRASADRVGRRPERLEGSAALRHYRHLATTLAVISVELGGFSPRPRVCSASWMTMAWAPHGVAAGQALEPRGRRCRPRGFLIS